MITYARYWRKKIESETVQMMRQTEMRRYFSTSLSSSCADADAFCLSRIVYAEFLAGFTNGAPGRALPAGIAGAAGYAAADAGFITACCALLAAGLPTG